VEHLESVSSALRVEKEQLEWQLRQMQHQLNLSATITELDRLSEGADSMGVLSDGIAYGASDRSGLRPTTRRGEREQQQQLLLMDSDLDSPQATLES
jgi:hypothetical protein